VIHSVTAAHLRAHEPAPTPGSRSARRQARASHGERSLERAARENRGATSRVAGENRGAVNRPALGENRGAVNRPAPRENHGAASRRAPTPARRGEDRKKAGEPSRSRRVPESPGAKGPPAAGSPLVPNRNVAGMTRSDRSHRVVPS
jgi:hypothetical protein